MIPKVILQSSKDPYPDYVNKMWEDRTDSSWKIVWYSDDDIIQFFKDNPISEFPNIINVFNSFTDGGHKTDLFRYYYLYLNGGFFIDSDVMPHVHMNSIHTTEVDHILVFSDLECNRISNPDLPGPIVFNGFMGCIPKSQLVLKALRNAYRTKDKVLQLSRLYFVYMLHLITEEYKSKYNILFFTEQIESAGASSSYTIDKFGNKLFTHYFGQPKLIPESAELRID